MKRVMVKYKVKTAVGLCSLSVSDNTPISLMLKFQPKVLTEPQVFLHLVAEEVPICTRGSYLCHLCHRNQKDHLSFHLSTSEECGGRSFDAPSS